MKEKFIPRMSSILTNKIQFKSILIISFKLLEFINGYIYSITC